ncbi:MAG: DUF429 domain-containing protein [Chloroflexi bacterium]|nr:DUF429 domain-containing protein [Chloroflexota bacterium]
MSPALPTTILGLDFSGGRAAARHSWLAVGERWAGGLRVERLFPLAALGASSRETAYAALRAQVRACGWCAVGIDASFSLPAALVPERDWTALLATVCQHDQTAEEWRKDCRRRVPGQELRRQTDRLARTPFSPYNVRAYRQTFFVLRDVLAPLREEGACVLPMDAPRVGRPWVLEVCPAVTLRQAGWRLPYKGRSARATAGRGALLAWLQQNGLQLADPTFADQALADAAGDALDALIAAVTVALVLAQPEALQRVAGTERCEGWVYRPLPGSLSLPLPLRPTEANLLPLD